MAEEKRRSDIYDAGRTDQTCEMGNMFNSAMLYELAAMRKYAEPILAQVRENEPENAEAYRLLRFLRYFSYLPDDSLPRTSLLREFLGGGVFEY